MKTLQQWFDDYAVSHQNETNITIHYICVPAIFFSIIGLFMSIPSGYLNELTKTKNPFLVNWATIPLLLFLFFYLRLSLPMFFKMLIFSILCILGNYYLGEYLPLFYTSITIFVIAWIGQFYGHKLEGAKPSFLKDLQFLLIGPAWVVKKIFR